MRNEQTAETLTKASLQLMLDLLKERNTIFPWEAAFALKIKTSEAMELLSQLEKQRKAEKFTVESMVKECTGLGCIGCDCTNNFIKKEIKYRANSSINLLQSVLNRCIVIVEDCRRFYCMKKQIPIIFIFLFVFQMAFGQSKVAVLDASLGDGVHPNAAAIVADTINEQFVKSADYIAIDRAYISSIQEEKKFQLSGDVKTDDIKELGITFGAEFLCIANVSQLGSTYTVSARLIEVETAQVIAQESARMQGQIDVLFNIAETVGSKLIGKELTSTDDAEEIKPEKAETTVAIPNQKEKFKSKAFSRTTVSYMMPSYFGSGYDYLDSILIGYMGSSGYDSWTLGMDIHSLITIEDYNYLSLSISFGAEYITSYISDGYFQYDTDYMSFSNMDLRISSGLLYPLFNFIQIYGGLGVGYQYVIISDEAWNTSTFNESEYGSFLFGLEFGGDLRFGSAVISMRFQIGMSSFPEYTLFSTSQDDFGYTAFMIGAGYTF